MQVTLTHGLLNLKRMEASKSLGPTDGQPSSRFRESCCLSWISCRVIDQSTQPPLPVSVHGGYTKCMDTCMHRTHICVCTGHAHVYAQNTKTCIHRTHIYTCIHRIHTHIHTSVQPWRRRGRLRFCLDTNILLFFKFFFFLRVSLCRFRACPETCSVGQAGLELTEILLPLPPKCWD